MMIKSLKKERKRRKPSLLRTLDVLLFVIKVLCGFVMYHLLQLIATSEDVHGNSSNKQSVVVDKAHQLPEWITDYVKWHHEMRAKYPGKLLFEDPNAPKVLIRTCLGLCGGL